MEKILKEVSINELKEKENKLREQLNKVCEEMNERKRRDLIIAELYHKFDYIGTLDDFVETVDKFDTNSLYIIEYLLNENRRLKDDLRDSQNQKFYNSKEWKCKTCKGSLNEYYFGNDNDAKISR